jgi:peptidyl-prolyl cis-trans isomerase B (cyclophilin B)
MPRPGPLLVALLVVLGLGLASCGDDEETSTAATTAGGDCAEVDAPAPKELKFKKPSKVLEPDQPATATVQTSCGEFVIELDTKRSPATANSFAFLAQQGFYDDTVFHRIVPGFVIQAGDPKGADPTLAGSGGPGYSVREPPPQRTTYRTGLVAMAKTAVEPPGTSGSQFFIVTAPADAGLPADSAVLGQVSKGLHVVKAIGRLGDPATDRPTRTVLIDSIAIDAG